MTDETKWYEKLLPSWPTTWPSTVFGLGIAILLLGSLIYYSHNQMELQGLQSVIAVFNNKGDADISVDRVYVFTTASYLTKYDLAHTDLANIPIEDKLKKIQQETPWYYVDDPQALTCNKDAIIEQCLGKQIKDFVEKLNSLKKEALPKSIQGYEFYESLGSGSKPLKRGFTWKVTIPHGSKFERDDLIRIYVEHWHRPNGIYIEEIKIPHSRK
ncbi:hypothetical protein JCM14076_24400 [Methylosoma difficile]